jgi:hypothetical protein
MAQLTPDQARAYLSRCQQVREVEKVELRQATVETRLQQHAALMASRELFGVDPDREAQVSEVRQRWADLKKVVSVRHEATDLTDSLRRGRICWVRRARSPRPVCGHGTSAPP